MPDWAIFSCKPYFAAEVGWIDIPSFSGRTVWLSFSCPKVSTSAWKICELLHGVCLYSLATKQDWPDLKRVKIISAAHV